MRLFRVACAVYGVALTVLLLVPDPAALLGIERTPGTASGRGTHLLFFTLLAFLVWASRWPVRRRLLAGLLITYAVATEGLQWFVPLRTVELPDLVENLLGLAAGTAIWWIAQKKRGKDRY
jgi:hypothetical protein